MEWGSVIRKEREGCGLSQKQLAALTGLHQSVISRIEQGSRPLALDEAVRIASVLSIPLQWFLTGTTRPGRQLSALAMEVSWLGASDLRVTGAAVPGAFLPAEEVIAAVLSPARVDPRALEALPAVLAWNHWRVGLLEAFARETDRWVINRLGWLAEIVLVIERTEGFPGGLVSANELAELRLRIDQPRDPDDLGHPGNPPPSHRVWRWWKIGYAADLTTFRDRAQELVRQGSGPRRGRADA
jgi:transcriptional regulator with XRE-family HTH domain